MIRNSVAHRGVICGVRLMPRPVATPALWTAPYIAPPSGSYGIERDLTISASEITVTGPGVYSIDTEGAAASNELKTINGGNEGIEITLKCEDNARLVKAMDGMGNINIGSICRLDDVIKRLVLRKDSAGNWHQISRP